MTKISYLARVTYGDSQKSSIERLLGDDEFRIGLEKLIKKALKNKSRTASVDIDLKGEVKIAVTKEFSFTLDIAKAYAKSPLEFAEEIADEKGYTKGNTGELVEIISHTSIKQQKKTKENL